MNNTVFVVGLGPGDPQFLTAQAQSALQKAEVLCGYTVYLDLVRPYYPEKEYYATGMTKELDRCRWALETAQSGKTVALICSGDAGERHRRVRLARRIERSRDDMAVSALYDHRRTCQREPCLGIARVLRLARTLRRRPEELSVTFPESDHLPGLPVTRAVAAVARYRLWHHCAGGTANGSGQ